MGYVPYVMTLEAFEHPLLYGVQQINETTDPVELADIHARTDKGSKPFTHAVQAFYGRNKALLLYVSFEDTSKSSALFHLWLPSYYDKYGRK
jgi:hypothetical protein